MMCTRVASVSAVCCLSLAAGSLAQNVDFQIVPLAGTTVNPGVDPVVVVQPGTILPYEVVVAAQSDPLFPTRSGIAGFNFNVLTNFGRAQTNPFTFGNNVQSLFSLNQGFGSFLGDDVLDIGGRQDLSPSANILTTFGLNNRQTIGTGQLVVPGFEGDFNVNLVGTADLLDATGFGMTAVPGLVSPSTGFTVQTRFNAGTDNDGNDGGTGGTGNGGGSGSGGGGEPVVVGGGGGTLGPRNPGSGGEQVAGSTPEGPSLINNFGGGFCGLGAASTLALTALGLGFMKRARL